MEKKIEIAKQIAEEIKALEGVATAHVDDYNKYADFQVVAVLELDDNKKPVNKNFSILKIRNGIKKIFNKHKNNLSMFGKNIDTPKRVYDTYTYRGVSDCTFKGYEQDYVMIDFVVSLDEERVDITDLMGRKNDL